MINLFFVSAWHRKVWIIISIISSSSKRKKLPLSSSYHHRNSTYLNIGIFITFFCWNPPTPSPSLKVCLSAWFESPQYFSVNNLTKNSPFSPVWNVVGMTTYLPGGRLNLLLTSLKFTYWSVLPTCCLEVTVLTSRCCLSDGSWNDEICIQLFLILKRLFLYLIDSKSNCMLLLPLWYFLSQGYYECTLCFIIMRVWIRESKHKLWVSYKVC